MNFIKEKDKKNGKEIVSKKMEQSDTENKSDNFFDIIVNIEENIADITEEANSIAAGMLELGEFTNEQNRKLKTLSGSGSASHSRKIFRSVAEKVLSYSNSIEEKIPTLNDKWSFTEFNVFSLLSNKIAFQQISTNQISGFLTAFENMKSDVEPVIPKLEFFNESLQSIRGLEKNLTSASIELERNINEFILFLEQIILTSDKIRDFKIPYEAKEKTL